MTENKKEVKFATDLQILAAQTFQEREKRKNSVTQMIESEKDNFNLRKIIFETKIANLEAELLTIAEDNEIMIKKFGLVPGDIISQNAEGKWIIEPQEAPTDDQ